MKKQKCLNCGDVLYEYFEQGGIALMNINKKANLLYSNEKYFYLCEKCRARNIVVEQKNKNGVSGLRVIDYEKN